MPMEARGDAPGRSAHGYGGFILACTRLRIGPSRGVDYRRHSMNMLPALQTILNELEQRFGAQILEARAPQPNELYLHAKVEVAGALCSAFYKKYNGRLAGVFAEDSRAQHKVF